MATIVIVDDDPFLRIELATRLGDWGYRIDTGEDAESGHAAVLRSHPDLIICDVDMPGSGFLLLNKVRGNEDRTGITPFIFLSAEIELARQQQGLQSGADDYLCKPVSPTLLRAKIEAHLRRHDRTRQFFLDGVSRVFALAGAFAGLAFIGGSAALLAIYTWKWMIGIDLSDELHFIEIFAG